MEKFVNNNLCLYFSPEELETIYKVKDLYLKALLIIIELYKNAQDKEGKPYIGHLIRVSNKLDELVERVAGLLHDTIEDTKVTYNDLIEIGFPKEIVDIVLLVTNKNIESNYLSRDEKLQIYYDKIDSIINSGNIHAIRLKEADMSDNYNADRIYYLPIESQVWAHDKYRVPLQRLRKKINEIEDNWLYL